MVDKLKYLTNRPKRNPVIKEFLKPAGDGKLLTDGVDQVMAGLHLNAKYVLCQGEICLGDTLPPVALIMQTVGLVVDVEGVVVTPVLLVLSRILDVDTAVQTAACRVIDPPTASIGAFKSSGQEVDVLRDVRGFYVETVVDAGYFKAPDIHNRRREQAVDRRIELVHELISQITVEIVKVGNLCVIQQRDQLTRDDQSVTIKIVMDADCPCFMPQHHGAVPQGNRMPKRLDEMLLCKWNLGRTSNEIYHFPLTFFFNSNFL